MADGRKSISSRYNSQKTRSNSSDSSGVVSHIILNEDDELIPKIQSSETNPKPSDAYIGHVVVSKHSDFSSDGKTSITYAPFDNSEGVPIVGETVALLKLGGNLFYTRIPNRDLNRGNAVIGKNKSLNPETENSSNASNYKEISQTKTPEASNTQTEEKLGEYFKPADVNQLRLYEGDRIIQSRFGQSIRFSGYNNEEKILSPTIIIRNGQNSKKLEKNELTEEDINKDGSTIALTSNKYKLDFQPGLVDDGGSSNFKTTPLYAEIPEEYIGNDQILINSERLIFSAKSQETLFFSKGNYSIISDGNLTMDFGESGKLDFGDDFWLTTDKNNANVWVNSGFGEIRLNTDSQGNSPSRTGPEDSTGQKTLRKEPLVRGESLVELLKELIDTINKQVYNTPAGPTAVGPTNRADFNDIKSRLNDVLSTLNFTE